MEVAELDTIVAVGTPPGPGALAVVRLSGPAAASVAAQLCPGLPCPPEPRKAALASVVDPDSGERLDQVLVTVFPGPASYTGEEMAEICCHGGWLAPSLILEACVRVGARRAEKGEFTRRAYLNGKLDLLQAEAVADLIESRSEARRRVALHQLEGGLSRRIAALKEELVGLDALIAQQLDFPEEGEPPLGTGEVVARARRLERTLESLLCSAPEGELLREGAVTVLAGPPNSGKSSLFNALLGRERAIVTEAPGTTRDALEAVVSLGGFPFRLVDTAGLRESQERVERLGIEMTRRYLQGANLVLYCLEAGEEVRACDQRFLEDAAGAPVVLIRTKVDLGWPEGHGGGPRDQCVLGDAAEWGGGGRQGEAPPCPTDLDVGRFRASVGVSAETGEGLEALRKLLPRLVFSGMVGASGDAPVLTRRRHEQGARRALAEVTEFRVGLETGLPAEVVATHLLSAETALEELLGVVSREEVLDRLFGDFCVGK